jgi:hypothetical protein
MASTTNYSWSTPDDTDLVKDGAAAIRTLGSSADTTVKNLNPGTTAGDIDYYTSSTAKARIGIGTAGQVLQVNSGATAPEWATATSGGMTQLATGSLSGTEVSLTSISQIYNNLVLVVNKPIASTANRLRIRVNNNTSSDYKDSYFANGSNSYANQSAADNIQASGGQNINTTETNAQLTLQIPFYALTGYKVIDYLFSSSGYGSSMIGFAYYNASTAISSIQIRLDGSATFSAGTYTLYGVK